ncbi:FHA domain-containing protein [Leptothoe kymatousa]|uniref:FHA domain-containing protein n=1 Tax=Leptothoe kymatousa TAU-MAC 1615 TaxID=2364775 RepID=A0ABS5XYX8_9CYAN|nr:FHA domain-containing protein [Leptothoe kymatousa]MBT9310827.1 FHA domain-containing protein [Leptothoe kymatousa TAU-MAC 1615]
MSQLHLVETCPGQATQRTPIALHQFPITIGRGNCTYRVAMGNFPNDYRDSISRVQATILKQNGQVWLKDGGEQPSANGVYVAGKKMHPHT